MTSRRTAAPGATDDPPLLRISGPADLVQAVPYLLGFHPLRSLVLLGLSGRRVVVTARLDLDDVTEPGLLRHTLAGLAGGDTAAIIAAVFDDDAMPPGRRRTGDRALPWAGLVGELDRLAEQAGMRSDDAVLVSNERLWSYTCADERCCPSAGTRVVPSTEVAAVATYAGMVALPDRASLAGTLEPVPDAERAPLLPALLAAEHAAVAAIATGAIARENRSVVRALFATCRAWDVPGVSPPLGDDDVVRFAVALQRIAVRDSLWIGIDDGRVDGRELWRVLARRLPEPFDAPALFLFGWRSYREGNGALAGMAARRALDSDPGYSAADLLAAALSQALDPHKLPRLTSRRSA